MEFIRLFSSTISAIPSASVVTASEKSKLVLRKVSSFQYQCWDKVFIEEVYVSYLQGYPKDSFGGVSVRRQGLYQTDSLQH